MAGRRMPEILALVFAYYGRGRFLASGRTGIYKTGYARNQVDS
jgi:hypothetical protein